MIEEETWAWLEISQTKQFRNERLRALSSRATRGICSYRRTYVDQNRESVGHERPMRAALSDQYLSGMM